MSEPLQVLFEDNHCVVVAKPAPLLIQGVPQGIPTLEAMVKEYLKDRYNKAGNVYLGIPHRLDRPVSGVVVFARNTKAARRLAEQFQKHEVTKVYWAAVEGQVTPAEGTWEDWLRKVPEQARSERTTADIPRAQRALMDYRVMQQTLDASLVEFRPRTGRMHQIRVQTSVRGWPIWGDLLYGSTRPFGPAAKLSRDRTIALHARSLTFLHPIRYEPMTVTAPLPETWRDLPFDFVGIDGNSI